MSRKGNTMKLISWNIDSLNAALTSDSARAKLSQEVLQTLVAEDADIIAIQETNLSAKGPTKKHLEILEELFPQYENTWRSSQEPARKGYAGTMFLYKKELSPIVTFPEIGAPSTMDLEGRIITLEFDGFFVKQVYNPNSGYGLKRLAELQVWYVKYAHKEIDLANPASNRRSPGFTDEERAGFTNLLAAGFTDTFRHLHGDVPERYTWWAQRSKTSKINNTGWRIDYWLTSNRIADKVTKSDMIDSGARQDHTPIVLEIEL